MRAPWVGQVTRDKYSWEYIDLCRGAKRFINGNTFMTFPSFMHIISKNKFTKQPCTNLELLIGTSYSLSK